jgi:hypothetical protein
MKTREGHRSKIGIRAKGGVRNPLLVQTPLSDDQRSSVHMTFADDPEKSNKKVRMNTSIHNCGNRGMEREQAN